MIFIKNLRLNSISITHIENFLIHFNDENSVDFITKTETAVKTLHNLIHFHKIDPEDTRLSNLYIVLKKLYLNGIVRVIYQITKKRILTNLTSENPNLYVLDFYKLGCYCNLKK